MPDDICASIEICFFPETHVIVRKRKKMSYWFAIDKLHIYKDHGNVVYMQKYLPSKKIGKMAIFLGEIFPCLKQAAENENQRLKQDVRMF